MSYFFLDSSALVKRYLRETGSVWVATLFDAAARNTIVVARSRALKLQPHSPLDSALLRVFHLQSVMV